MADVRHEVLSTDFDLWLQNLQESTKAVSDALEKPVDEDELTEAFDDMKVDEAQLAAFRPTVKKNYPYDFSLALPFLATAKRLTAKVVRILKVQSTTSSEPHVKSPPSDFKLPKLDIPKFHGEYDKYQEFIQMYNQAVHNTSLSNVQKFTYLKTYIKGDAEKQISGFPITKEGYTLAYNFLEETYGDKRIIIQQLYDKLKLVPKATKSLASIRSTYEALEPPLRMLDDMEEDIDGNMLLYNLIVEKYEPETLIPYKESISTVTSLQKTVRGILLCAKKLQPTSLGTKQGFPGTTTAALAVVSQQSTPKYSSNSSKTTTPLRTPSRKCPFCLKEGHWADECTEFKTTAERKAQIRGSCFICLKSNHMQKDCRSTAVCAHCKDVKKHHRSLCPKKFGFPEKEKPKQTDKPTVPDKPTSSDNTSMDTKTATPATTVLTDKEQGTFLTLMTTIRNPATGVTTNGRLILDCCSSHSYVLESTTQALNLPRHKENTFNIKKFQGESKQLQTAETEFELVTPYGTSINIQANTTPAIIDTVSTINVDTFRKQYPQYNNLAYADNGEGKEIQILIGGDYFCKLLTFQHIEVNNEIDLMHTKFGWLIAGRMKKENQSSSILLTTARAIERLWSLDQIGISTESLNEEENEQKALQNFYSNIEVKDGRYEVSWPWIEYPPNLPDNYGLAVGRLRSLLRTYDNNPELIKKYDEIFQEQERTGIIECVPETEIDTKNPTHYLPHHLVISENKSTNLRSVFDGSAKSSKRNKSLNECIYKGKLFLIHIAIVLLRFRIKLYLLLADVEKAFHQIQLQLKDRDVVRFLWLKDITKPFSFDNLKILRFCRTPFGVIASLFLLLATIYYHFITTNSKYLEVIKKELYSDNLVTGSETVAEAIEMYKDLKTEFKKMSMNLRKWVTNSPEIEKQIPIEDRDTSPVINILGINWSKIEDTISIKPTSIRSNTVTKRIVLSVNNSVFDPLGLMAPILLPAKLLLKRITEEKYDWDCELPKNIVEEWLVIKSELEKIHTIQIPRYVKFDKELSVHCFVDASVSAFGVAIYLRSQAASISTNLIFAKARITPNRNLSVPKLELIAVVLGIRCLKFVINALDLPQEVEKYIWSDSKCVLSWIETSKTLPVFVTRRVQEIRTLPDTKFCYVPTADNTADMATRGTSISTLITSNWFQGPDWLNKEQNYWPNQPILPHHEPDKESLPLTVPVLITDVDKSTPFNLDPKRYSSYTKLINITVLCIKAVSKLLYKFSGGKVQRNIKEPIYTYAEMLWVKFEQRNWYAKEIKCLRSNTDTATIRNLNLYLDENNIIRSKGRYDSSPLPEGTKNPILLPHRGTNNPFLELLIQHVHKSNFHAGVSHTLAAIREKYWIPQGRRAVFETIRKMCKSCVRFNTAPFKAGEMASLPNIRFNSLEPPFTYMGIDIFGPLNVKKWINKVQVVEKRYGLIITCLVIRAVHIEILESISTNDIILALRTFISRRTKPQYIISDNAKQFLLCDRVFQDILKEQINKPNSELSSFLTQKAITWKFVPNYAPWRGGIYERLIALIKDALKRTFRHYLLTDKMLVVVIAEIGATINARPLSYVGEEPDAKILRPADFLQQKYPPTLAINEENSTNRVSETHKSIVKKWRKSETLLNNLWKIWQSDYILALRERGNQLKSPGRTTQRIPNCGEVVLLALPNTKRNDWQMAVVTKLIPSHDGIIRTAEVRFATGRKAEYATNHLAPMELDFEEEDESTSRTAPENAVQEEEKDDSDFEIDEITVVEVDDED